MQGMFTDADVRTMVIRRSAHGMPEWISGFRDIHASAMAAGLSTPMLDRQARVLDRCARDPGAPGR